MDAFRSPRDGTMSMSLLRHSDDEMTKRYFKELKSRRLRAQKEKLDEKEKLLRLLEVKEKDMEDRAKVDATRSEKEEFVQLKKDADRQRVELNYETRQLADLQRQFLLEQMLQNDEQHTARWMEQRAYENALLAHAEDLKHRAVEEKKKKHMSAEQSRHEKERMLLEAKALYEHVRTQVQELEKQAENHTKKTERKQKLEAAVRKRQEELNQFDRHLLELEMNLYSKIDQAQSDRLRRNAEISERIERLNELCQTRSQLTREALKEEQKLAETKIQEEIDRRSEFLGKRELIICRQRRNKEWEIPKLDLTNTLSATVVEELTGRGSISAPTVPLTPSAPTSQRQAKVAPSPRSAREQKSARKQSPTSARQVQVPRVNI